MGQRPAIGLLGQKFSETGLVEAEEKPVLVHITGHRQCGSLQAGGIFAHIGIRDGKR